eukprot:4184038-Prymnesium_polylepis.1
MRVEDRALGCSPIGAQQHQARGQTVQLEPHARRDRIRPACCRLQHIEQANAPPRKQALQRRARGVAIIHALQLLHARRQRPH